MTIIKKRFNKHSLVLGMKITELYEVIRREGVCLFVGSACSTYANYPNVEKLKIILNEILKESHPEGLDLQQNLMDFAEDYVALRGREDLVSKLQSIFLNTPTSTTFHDNLAKIPHFQTIITTNYDKMLEGSFKGATVITNDSDVAEIIDERPMIYKIHGDIEIGSSIVITRSDYVAIQKRDFRDPFWASIVHEISKKNVLFFGYGYEDDNVRADFDYVYGKLGRGKKQRFMIGRSSTELKLKKLKQRGVDFIVCDADEFISGFISHLKNHIVADAKKKWISPNAAQKFIHSFDKRTVLHSSPDGLDAVYITRPDGLSNQKFEIQAIDQSIIQGLQDFNKSYDMKELTIKREHMTAFTHEMEGFTVIDLDDVSELKLMMIPSATGICTLEFPAHPDLELSGVKYEVLNHIGNKIRLMGEVYGFKMQVDLVKEDDNFKFNFKITEPKSPIKIKHYCEVFQAVIWFLSGELVQSTTSTGVLKEHRLTAAPDLQGCPEILKLYNMLWQIEKFFKVKLPVVKINDITAEEQNVIRNLSSLLINKYTVIRDINAQLTIDLPGDPALMDKILHGIPKDTYLILERNQSKVCKIFGVTLDLGTEQISILDPTIKSFDIIKKSAVLVPRDFTIVTRYSATGFFDTDERNLVWSVNRNGKV